MFSSVGCPNGCTFCTVQTKVVQFKRVDTVLNEMQYLYTLGCRSIHILDDNFNINSGHIKNILDAMDRRGFYCEWSGRGQVRMNLDLVKDLAEHGFKRIHAGIEALDNRILNYFNKHINIKHIQKFCKEMNRYDVDVLGYFILGSPVEPENYRRRLSDMIRELSIRYPYFNILFPEPCTEYYHQLIRDGVYKKDYWKDYMANPVPNYEIPYPYGSEKYTEVVRFTQDMIDEFKGGAS